MQRQKHKNEIASAKHMVEKGYMHAGETGFPLPKDVSPGKWPFGDTAD